MDDGTPDQLRPNILARIHAIAEGLAELEKHFHASEAEASVDDLSILSLSLRRLDGQVDRLKLLLPPIPTPETTPVNS